jgi:hypothetical protein
LEPEKVQTYKKQQQLRYLHHRLYEIFVDYLQKAKVLDIPVVVLFRSKLPGDRRGLAIKLISIETPFRITAVLSAGLDCSTLIHLEFHPQRLSSVWSMTRTNARNEKIDSGSHLNLDYTRFLKWYLVYNKFLPAYGDTISTRWVADHKRDQPTLDLQYGSAAVFNLGFKSFKKRRQFWESSDEDEDQYEDHDLHTKPLTVDVAYDALPCHKPFSCDKECSWTGERSNYTICANGHTQADLQYDQQRPRLFASTRGHHRSKCFWRKKAYDLELDLAQFLCHDVQHRHWEEFVDEWIPEFRFSHTLSLVKDYLGGLPESLDLPCVDSEKKTKRNGNNSLISANDNDDEDEDRADEEQDDSEEDVDDGSYDSDDPNSA